MALSLSEYLKLNKSDPSCSLIGCRPSASSLSSAVSFSSPCQLEEVQAKLKQITLKKAENHRKLLEEIEVFSLSLPPSIHLHF